MKDFSALASKERVTKTAAALEANGFSVVLAANAEDAKKKVLDLVSPGSEVFTSSSITLDQTGIEKEINGSGRFESAKGKLYSMDQNTQAREMRKYGAAPDVFIGSAHGVSESGVVVVGSLTGSQLPGIAYAAGQVILVVGTQKVVKDLDEALERIESYVTPKESVRARAAYGLPDSFNSYASKLLVLRKEVQPKRVTIVLVDEALGF